MATPYAGVTDDPNSLHTERFSPDFSFLQAGLQKKENTYLQNQQQIASDYSAILNAPILNTIGQQVKQDYLRNVQEGLKKIATTDLSLPKNVTQAENLYAPFWQDDLMLKHIAATKNYQNEIQTATSYMKSKDKDIREQYNPIAMEYLQQGATKLKNAEWNHEAIDRLTPRKFVPFVDIDKDIDDAYREEQQKGVETVDVTGNGIVTRHNGIDSKEAFKTYYLSKVGSKYDQQLYVTESVRVQRAKDEILQQNPGLSERELNLHFATEQMQGLDKAYQGNINAYNSVADTWVKKHDALYEQIQTQPGKKPTQQQLDNLNEYANRAKAYQDAVTQYKNEYSKYGSGNVNDPLYHKTVQDIAEHPEDYLTHIQKSIMADNWAQGMASMSVSTKIELDPRWKGYMEEADKAADRALTLRGQNITARGQDITSRGQTLDYQQKTGRDLQGNLLTGYRPDQGGWSTDKGTGTGSTGTGVPNPASGSFEGPATTDAAHLQFGLDKIEQIQAENISKVTNSVYDTKGIAASLRVDGVDGNTIIDFTEGAKALEYGRKPTESQMKALFTVRDVLHNRGINVPIGNPGQLQAAMLKYSSIAAEDLLKSGNLKQVEQGRDLLVAYMGVTQSRDKVLANQATYQRALQDKLFSNPKEFDKLIVQDQNGNLKHITTDDMAKDFPSLTLKEKDGTIVHLNSKEVAERWSNGNLHIPYGGLVAVGDKKITDYHHWLPGLNQDELVREWNSHIHGTRQVKGPDGQIHTEVLSGSGSASGGTKPAPGSIIDKYGSPGNISKLNRKLSESVVPLLQEGRDGLIVQKIGFDPDIPAQLPMAIGLSKELANPSVTNTSAAYEQKTDINNSIPTKDMPKIISAVRSVIGSAEEMKAYTSGPHKIITPDGTPAYEYTFKSNAPDKVIGNEGVNLSSLAGRKFVLPLMPGVQTPFVSSIPTGNFIHNELLYSSAPIKSDPTIESSGFRSTIRAFEPVNGRNTKCAIIIEKCIPDIKKPGQTKWVVSDETEVNLLQGPNAKTPDEAYNVTNRLLVNHLGNIVNQAKLKTNNPSIQQ